MQPLTSYLISQDRAPLIDVKDQIKPMIINKDKDKDTIADVDFNGVASQQMAHRKQTEEASTASHFAQRVTSQICMY